MAVAAYVEELGKTASPPTVTQHLAAIRVLCDWFVLGQVLPMSPAACVRGPRYKVKIGRTPILSLDEVRTLLCSIDPSTLIGLRDRALIGVMFFTFARVSAAVGMRAGDYADGRIRLLEKGGKRHVVPVHRDLRSLLDEYLARAIRPKCAPLFPSFQARSGRTKGKGMSRGDALRMIQRRAKAAGITSAISCHSFRGSGITAYLGAGGTIERAQAIAAHESAETTKLYDRNKDEITAAELERIHF